MGISNQDLQAIAQQMNVRFKQKQQQVEDRRVRAQAYACQLALTMGQSDSSLRQVIGFGSTFETWRRYRFDSDIDLGIVGGDWSFLMSLIVQSEFDVSLIDLSEQGSDFSELVRKNGVVLYEQQ